MKNRVTILFLVSILIISCNSFLDLNQTEPDISYFKIPIDLEVLLNNNFYGKRDEIYEVQTLRLGKEIRLFVSQSNSETDTTTYLSTFNKELTNNLGKLKLESSKVHKSCFPVLVTRKDETYPGYMFIESDNTLKKRSELVYIDIEGKIIHENTSFDQNRFYNLLPKKGEFEYFEQDSIIVTYDEHYGIEPNTYAYKFSIMSPKKCVTEIKHFNQDLNENRILIGPTDNNYAMITEETIKIYLNEFKPSCDDEIINLNTTYHR
jgi:hypothetical protein